MQPSPYRPGTGIEPPYLGDRETELDDMRRFLAEPGHPRNVLVTGLRGVGKTVLLNHYSALAEGAGWIVVEREFVEADAEPHSFAQALLLDLTRTARRISASARLSAAVRGLAEAALDFLGTLGVSYGDVTVRVTPGRQQAPTRFDDDLREAMTRVGELCRGSGHPGVMLRYDEFHVIRERRGETTLSALLAAVAHAQQHELPVMLVLAGLPPIVENLARAKSYSERMFVTQRLGNLRPPEDRAALVDPAVRLGRRYEDAVVDQVLEDTGGYPFFIQVYGDALWAAAPEAVIRERDFAKVRPRIRRGLDEGFFEARYARASRGERALLHQIARFGEGATVEQVIATSGKRNHELQPLVTSLISKGLVYRPARGELAFTAPMFGAFLRRNPE